MVSYSEMRTGRGDSPQRELRPVDRHLAIRKNIVEVGTAGQLNYVADNEGGIYTTMEALRRRGVSKLYIQAGYELHLG